MFSDLFASCEFLQEYFTTNIVISSHHESLQSSFASKIVHIRVVQEGDRVVVQFCYIRCFACALRRSLSFCGTLFSRPITGASTRDSTSSFNVFDSVP